MSYLKQPARHELLWLIRSDAASATLFGAAFLSLTWLLMLGAAQPGVQEGCSTPIASDSVNVFACCQGGSRKAAGA